MEASRVRWLGSTLLVVAFVVFGLRVAGQVPILQFEVASIRRHLDNGDDKMGGTNFPNGRMTATYLTLGDLIRSAFDISRDQMSGGPSWIETQRFDVIAKAPEGREYTEEDFRQMLKGLLIDRFSLRSHQETRDVSVYVLTVARNGSKLRESAPETLSGVTLGLGRIKLSKVTLGALTAILPQFVGRPVIDRTGLPEKYFDLTLTWTPDLVSNQSTSSSPPAQSGPSIFTAIEEQLGLRLESKREPQAFLIVDEASPPSDN